MSSSDETVGPIVIVGAGLAAVRTVEELRRSGYDGELVLVGDEPHLPYDRPPLSKEVVRGEHDDTTLRPREFYAEHRVDLRLGVAATGVDCDRRVLHTAGGSEIAYGELIVATGLRPRRIPGLPELDGVHVLRSVDECRALRADLREGARALVVGAGFVGCELAASMRALGLHVVLVEPQPAPLASVLGEQVGALVGRLHTAEGVDVRTGVGLTALTGAGRVSGATLSDGTDLEVDVVAIGIGSLPVTDWLGGSGIDVGSAPGVGVVCDEVGRTSAPHVWAVGDVAAWRHDAGGHRRVEHWSNAGDQAKSLAGALTGSGDPDAPAQVPYFWSDQYGLKIQALGTVSATDDVHVVKDDGRKFVVYYSRGGALTGVVGLGSAGAVMKMRAHIAAGAPVAGLLQSAPA